MLKRLFGIAILCVLLSGCYMVPMALVGPAVSGFSGTSIMSAGLSIAVKHSTGKTIAQHAYDALDVNIIKQSYLPGNDSKTSFKPKPNLVK